MDARTYREVFYSGGLCLIVPESSVWDTIIGGSDMLSNGPNLGLLVNGAQGESHYTDLMKLLRGLDALVMPAVLDQDLTAPPGGESDGDRYIPAATASGDWAGKEKYIARYSSTTSGWEFYAPKEGWLVWVRDENLLYVYDGSAWVTFLPAAGTAIADIKDDYTTGDLDSEAEVISAVNEVATAVNDILGALRAYDVITT